MRVAVRRRRCAGRNRSRTNSWVYVHRGHYPCLHFLGAPSRTRTDTWRILSPLPLPIGLWGRCSPEHNSGRFNLVPTARIPQRYRRPCPAQSPRRSIVMEEMTVAAGRHRGGHVPNQSLHDLHISDCADRQRCRGVSQCDVLRRSAGPLLTPEADARQLVPLGYPPCSQPESSCGRRPTSRWKWPIRVCVPARLGGWCGRVVDPRRVGWWRRVAIVVGKLREPAREVRTRITAPPDQVITFTRLSGFCARPVLFEIE